MTTTSGTAVDLVERIQRCAPEFIDLITAEDAGQWDSAIDSLLQMAVDHLERNKKHLHSLGEDGLSAFVVARLAVPGLHVSRETYSGGHVDITIESLHSHHLLRSLGEAKIYDGYEYHKMGLEQLIDRYSTGRECRGFVIEYIKKENATGLMAALRSEMDEKRPCRQQGQSRDHTIPWAFLSSHEHENGSNVDVGHLGCDLFVR